MSLLTKLIRPVYAHCDVPCGIYETDTMHHAAETCAKMIEKIQALGDPMATPDSHNNFVRMVATKEKHAQLCKDQIYVLWSDYFKPEHLERFPDLHEVMWKAAKQCGKVKQTVSADEAHTLLHMVDDIAKMFKESHA